MEAHELLIIRDVKIQRHHHNEKVEKKTNNNKNKQTMTTIGLISKTITLHVHHTIVYISLLSLHD